jgi:hypothetical protein
MPRTGRAVRRGGQNTDYYELAVRQFQQQILPSGMPETTVWSYGSADHPASFNYPAFTIGARWRRPVRVKWINDLKDPSTGDFLPHILPVDPTLHWVCATSDGSTRRGAGGEQRREPGGGGSGDDEAEVVEPQGDGWLGPHPRGAPRPGMLGPGAWPGPSLKPKELAPLLSLSCGMCSFISCPPSTSSVCAKALP